MSVRRLRQFAAVVAVVVLAACDAVQNVSPNVGTGSNSRLGPTRVSFNHGRRFAAAYSGSYTKTGDCSATAMFTYKGNGNAKLLHSSSEQVKLTWFCGSADVTGSATLTSNQVSRDSITASLSSTDFKSPCDGFTMSFKVTGGTGRFRRASGSGTIILHTPSSECLSYSYSDKWRGTLKF
jgi:hypothetical protein